jgi:hypothetical protein
MKLAKHWVVVGAIGATSVAAGGVGVGEALASGATHTLSFKSIQLKNVDLSSSRFVNIGKDVSKGKTIGGNLLSCGFRPSARAFRCTVSFALTGGQMYGTFLLTNSTPDNLTHGRITGGVGAYKGVTGTLTGTSLPHHGENVTITYHR